MLMLMVLDYVLVEGIRIVAVCGGVKVCRSSYLQDLSVR